MVLNESSSGIFSRGQLCIITSIRFASIEGKTAERNFRKEKGHTHY
jgi:hypothetical protein